MTIPVSFHSAVLVLLVITCSFLVLLLIPLPKFAQKVVVGILGKVNARIFFWPTRVFLVILVLSVFLVGSYTEMTKYEVIASNENPNSNDYGRIHQDTQLKKFRAERNFYLHFCALIMVGITWRIQGLIYKKNNLEDEKIVLESTFSKDDKKNK